MKYIRTKNQIMAFTDLPYDIDSNGNQSYKGMKIADTIAELCDEFVLFTKDLNTRLLFGRDLKCLLENIKNYTYSCEIYGAIWTDSGLTYVAKMNEEGELELI